MFPSTGMLIQKHASNNLTFMYSELQFLSMKLAALNPRLEFNMDNLFPKEVNIYTIHDLSDYDLV